MQPRELAVYQKALTQWECVSSVHLPGVPGLPIASNQLLHVLVLSHHWQIGSIQLSGENLFTTTQSQQIMEIREEVSAMN